MSIPRTHADLLERPLIALLGTVNPDGQPQVTPVWVDTEDGHIRVNTAAGRQKWKNMLERPVATVTVVDPEDTQRYIEVRGRVARHTEERGWEVIQKLARDYDGPDATYPPVPGQTRVTFYIEPVAVRTHGASAS